MRRLCAALAACVLGLVSVEAQAAEAAACDLLWQVTPQFAAEPRQLQVDMSFSAGPRSRSTLRLPDGWTALSEDTAGSSRLQAVVGDPTLRSVNHAPGERVQLRWRLTPTPNTAQSGGAQLAANWFAFAGLSLLPVPEEIDEANPPSACVGFKDLSPPPDPALAASADAPTRWVSSHGQAEGASTLFLVAPGAATLRWRVQQALYAGGALQVLTRNDDGQTLTVVRPSAPAWRAGLEAQAQASSQALASQRRFWGDNTPAKPLLVLLLPSPSAGQAAAWHQAVAVPMPPDPALPGEDFDALIAGALMRTWIPDRFGPTVHTGRQDEVLRAWFSQGWAEFYAHRLLLREGRWTPEDFASALNRQIDRYLDSPDRAQPQARLGAGASRSEALISLNAARGEWLALQWHGALRAVGHPGLDAVMRGLLLPPAQAKREGLTSAPLATHRLLAALRSKLGEQPLRDIQRHVEQGEVFGFGLTTLGPCFVGRPLSVPAWRLGFDPASLETGVVGGVEPDGPAATAGLRNGMALLSRSLVMGDASQPVLLRVQGADGKLLELRYLPAGPPMRERMRYQAVPQAMLQPACQGWLGLGAQATPTGASPLPKAVAGKIAAKPKQAAKRGTKPGVKPGAKPGVKPAAKGGASSKPGDKKPGAKPVDTSPKSSLKSSAKP